MSRSSLAPKGGNDHIILFLFFFQLAVNQGFLFSHFAPLSVISRVHCATQKSSAQMNSAHYDSALNVFSLKLLNQKMTVPHSHKYTIKYFLQADCKWKVGVVP